MRRNRGDGGAENRGDGYGRKTAPTGEGEMALDAPRDRRSSFDPQLPAKRQRRLPDFDDSEKDQETIQWIVFPTTHLDVRPGA